MDIKKELKKQFGWMQRGDFKLLEIFIEEVKENIRVQPEVIKKICVHCWDEEKQTHNEIKVLSKIYTCQNIIPSKKERIWYDAQYEVDWVEYEIDKNKFLVNVYLNEV